MTNQHHDSAPDDSTATIEANARLVDSGKGAVTPSRRALCVRHDGGGPKGPGGGRSAVRGVLCGSCWSQLDEAMHDLPDLLALFGDTELEPGQHGVGEGRRGKVSGSPALIRLDVMVARGWGSEGDGVEPVWPLVLGWLDRVTETLGVQATPDDQVRPFSFLARWLDSIAAHRDLAGPFVTDMRRLWGMLRRVTGAPKPIGRCFGWSPTRPCGRALYPPEVTPPRPGERPALLRIKCPSIECGRTYTGAEILKLQIQQEREGTG